MFDFITDVAFLSQIYANDQDIAFFGTGSDVNAVFIGSFASLLLTVIVNLVLICVLSCSESDVVC